MTPKTGSMEAAVQPAQPKHIDPSVRPRTETRKQGLRAKARRGEGPLPAEVGIDYVGMWEGGKGTKNN